MANRGVFQGPAPTSVGQGGYEQADQPQASKEPHGPTYQMVMSEKTGEKVDAQDPHWTGQLLPVAHSRSEEVRGFFDGMNVMG